MSNEIVWYTLTPVEPLVWGDGRPLDRQKPEVWPIPATLSAAMNAQAFNVGGKAIQQKLKDSLLYGPLLWDGQEAFAPPPADLLLDDVTLESSKDKKNSCASKEKEWLPVKGKLMCGNYNYWPDDKSLPKIYHIEERKDNKKDECKCDNKHEATKLPLSDSEDECKCDHKLESLEFPFPLSWLVGWANGQPENKIVTQGSLTKKDSRIHVSIDPNAGTAAPGALYSSAGISLRAQTCQKGEVSYLFGWTGPELLPRGRETALVPVGGEGRMARLERCKEQSPLKMKSSEKPKDKGWLRLQLLTPAWFLGDDPTRPVELAGFPDLKLVAMRLGRYRAFSGWKHGIPREVRRIVPAGGVYWFGDANGDPLSPDLLTALIERLQTPNNLLSSRTSNLPNPSNLGFGLCLPGYTGDK